MSNPSADDPLIADLSVHFAAVQAAHKGPLLVGINGAQGSGKSTLAARLKDHLTARHRRSGAVLSLDDLYLTRQERLALARKVHPLCATRGVPGTHDVALGLHILASLRGAGPATATRLPRFDKLADDRSAECVEHVGRPDVILFEGWCVGAEPQPAAALAAPINALERAEDDEGVWRQWANDHLQTEYQELWRAIDVLVMIQVPDLDFVIDARLQQEKELAAADPERTPMSRAQIAHFVAHYERLTRHMWATLPARADVLLTRDRSGFRDLRLGKK